MPIQSGNQSVTNMYAGANQVDRVYLGSQQVWPSIVVSNDGITTALSVSGATATVSVISVENPQQATLELSSVSVGGTDTLGQVTSPTTPANICPNPAPGAVGSGGTVFTVASALEPGRRYLLSYEIASAAPDAELFLPTEGPFPDTTLPSTVGVHSVVVQAADTDTGRTMRLRASGGGMTIPSVTLYLAEWDFPVSAGVTGGDLFSQNNTGVLATSSGVNIGGTGALTPGTTYLLSYEIKRNSDPATNNLFVQGTGPFFFQDLPSTTGYHNVEIECQQADVNAGWLRANNTGGDIEMGTVLVREVLPDSGATITSSVTFGTASDTRQSFIPSPGLIYVSPSGTSSGTGAFSDPLRQPQEAIDRAIPGDIIYLRPGTYEPFEFTVDGTVAAPVSVTTLAGEERQATIDASTGSGGTAVVISGRSNIILSNLDITNSSSQGIGISNTNGDIRGNILLFNNEIHQIQQSAVRCVGVAPVDFPDTNVTTTYIENVTIRGNEIYSAYLTGNSGNEVITVSAGCSNIITEDNLIYNSNQYGIDYKTGVDGGVIRRNVIWGIYKHAIYLDTGKAYVRNIDVYDNYTFACNNGIVLVRERDPASDITQQDLSNIRVYNNVCWGHHSHGILCYAHPNDGRDGVISNIDIRFNTLVDCGFRETRNRQEFHLAGWTTNEFNGVVTNFRIAGNIAWRTQDQFYDTNVLIQSGTGTDASITVENTGFTIEDNHNFGGGHVDPLFSNYDPANPDPNNASQNMPFDPTPVTPPTGPAPLNNLQEILPDFSLQAGSPALGIVSGYNGAPYGTDINGDTRGNPSDAGAIERP